jgi:CO dehydrogenase maturation factor
MKTIAVAGKGGTGKTTLCGILINYLCEHKLTPVLAVDADANDNLNEVLGVEVEKTLGEIREVVARAEKDDDSPIPTGMSKQDYMEYQLQNALAEGDDFDMLVMGRTQGKGCYCYVNGLLTTVMSKITKPYRYIVVDNEAGMEHISRGTLPSIDTLLLVSDASRRGIQATGRIKDLAEELKLNPSMVKLIVNRAPSTTLDPGILDEIDKQGLDLLGVVPHDDLIYQYDCEGKPTSKLPKDSVARSTFEGMIETLL